MNTKWMIILIAVLVTVSTIAITYLSFENNATKQNHSSSGTNLACIYGVSGGLLKGTNACPISGIPSILSQVRNQIGGDLNYILENDKQQYRLMVFGGIECHPSCFNAKITEACHYDSNGEFVPQLSDAQKVAILDLNNSFSIPICPFTGKPNIFSGTPSPTIIGPSGSVNVRELPSITTQHNTNSTYNSASIHQTTNDSQR